MRVLGDGAVEGGRAGCRVVGFDGFEHGVLLEDNLIGKWLRFKLMEWK